MPVINPTLGLVKEGLALERASRSSQGEVALTRKNEWGTEKRGSSTYKSTGAKSIWLEMLRGLAWG